MLTDRQQNVLDFLGDFIAEKEHPPTHREIADHFGIGRNAVRGHLLSLQRKGFVDWTPAASRTLVCKRTSTREEAAPV
jgi:repressor LexA